MHDSYFEPLDDQELHDHLRLSLPPTDARAGWSFDERNILQALDILEIKIPVRIRFMTGKYRQGTHYSRKDYHRVTIHQGRGYVEASETLWHELAHCMQAERFAEETGKPITEFYELEYKPSDGRWGASYEENTLEMEAREIAAKCNERMKLCKS